MVKIFDKINIMLGFFVTVLSSIFGPVWFLFMGLMIMNIVDWISGWYGAYIKKEESSKVGAKGIVKKVWYWVVIAISFYIGFSFEKMGDILGLQLSFMNLLGYFVLSSYIVNEIRSILENFVKIGVVLPKFLVKGLKICSDIIEESAEITIGVKDNYEK